MDPFHTHELYHVVKRILVLDDSLHADKPAQHLLVVVAFMPAVKFFVKRVPHELDNELERFHVCLYMVLEPAVKFFVIVYRLEFLPCDTYKRSRRRFKINMKKCA